MWDDEIEPFWANGEMLYINIIFGYGRDRTARSSGAPWQRPSSRRMGSWGCLRTRGLRVLQRALMEKKNRVRMT